MRLRDTRAHVSGARWLRLYPRDWRDRYEAEMRALLEASPTRTSSSLDLIRGALDAHLHPRTPPRIPIGAAVVGALAWIIAGAATSLQPTMPDWPGFLLETLPAAIVGAVAGFRIVAAVGRRAGLHGARGTDVALVTALTGHLLWTAALVIAFLGGPYGAVTAAAQSIAAVGTIVVGLVRLRAGDSPAAEIVTVAGALMLVPSPVAWIALGGAWLSLAVVGLRTVVPPRPA